MNPFAGLPNYLTKARKAAKGPLKRCKGRTPAKIGFCPVAPQAQIGSNGFCPVATHAQIGFSPVKEKKIKPSVDPNPELLIERKVRIGEE